MDVSKTQAAKKNAKKPDIVTQELQKGFNWTTTHTGVVASVLGAFLVLGGGYTAWTMYSESKEKDLQAKYYDIETIVNKKRADFENAKNPLPAQPGAPAPVVTEKPTGDLTKDFGDSTTKLAEFAKDHGSSVAGTMAALNLASLQAEYNQSDAAIQTLQSVKPQKGFMGALLQMELATQLANAGKCPEASNIWSDLAGQDSAHFLKAEAKLKLGLCAETQGDLAKAESFYKEVQTEFKESAAGRSASQYLRLLAAKAPAAATN